MIELKSVSKIYSNDGVITTGLHHVTLSFQKGEIVGIVGESGSGKSTLLNVLTKTDTFEEGEYYFYGNETSYFDMDDMDHFRKKYVGFIYQNYNILEAYSVLENVMLPFVINGVDRAEAKKKALELIDKVGLSKRVHNRAAHLSGGEKQRCAIARALAMDAPILACDEPTGNLDAKTGADIIQLIREVAKERLVFIVTHNEKEVDGILTRKIRMKDGEVVEDILLEEKSSEEPAEMDLDYVPMKEKNRFGLAFSNLKNTPKMTVLSSLIFLCIAVFALILYQFTFYLSSEMSRDTTFVYQGDDKVIVYRADKSEVNLADLGTNTFVINDFTYDISIQSTVMSDAGYSSWAYECYPKNLNLTAGRMPENDNECILLVKADNGNAADLLNKDLANFSIYRNTSHIVAVHVPHVKIVGYQVRSDMAGDYYPVFTGSKTLEDMSRVMNMFAYCYPYISDYEIYYDYSGSTRFVLNNNYDTVSNDQFDTAIHDFGIDFEKLPVSVDTSLPGSILYLGNDMLDVLNAHPFEVSVYTSSPKAFMRKMANLGYETTRVSTYSSSSYNIQAIIQNILTIASMIFSSVALILLYFISYLILSRVYQAKTKEFGIFRILGVARKDMRHLVRIEVVAEMAVTSILTFAVFFILGKCINNGFFAIFSTIPAATIILYFTVLLLFSLLLGNRFNRRLFHFSAQGNLKGGKVK